MLELKVTKCISTVDQIYHLASPASPKHYMYNPIKTLKTNALGTLNLLGVCKHIHRAPVRTVDTVLVGLAKRVRARFLLASTSEVYGGMYTVPRDLLLMLSMLFRSRGGECFTNRSHAVVWWFYRYILR